MKYIVFGFYGKNNLGDMMFEDSFKHLLTNDQLTFMNAASMSEVKLNDYDAVIVGGGDMMNDFYGLKYMEALTDYKGYKIAIGVGFSFEECRTRKYVDLFDDIILRSYEDLRVISSMIGSKHVHRMPDLGFNLPMNLVSRDKTGKKVGIFLVGSIMSNYPLVFTLKMFIHWLISNDYSIELIPMFFQDDIKDNDVALNELLLKTFEHTGKITSCICTNMDNFLSKLSYLDYGICMRFHSAVFCTRSGLPFIALPLTRKIIIYTKELPYELNYTAEVSRKSNGIIDDINLDSLKNLFSKLVDNRETVAKGLLYNSEVNRKLFENNKIKMLLNRKEKRKIFRPLNEEITPDEIYIKYRNMFLSKGINPETDKPLDVITKQELHLIADELCYDITNNTCNDYAYGTKINLETKLKELKGMIHYIYYDHKNKTIKPKLNINYIKQDCFKGLHRAGWQYSIEPLYYFADNYGVFLDTYCDRTFGWCAPLLHNVGILPYTNYWIGFIHHTFDGTFSENNCENMFKSKLFLDSLPLCKGFFCLTEYLSKLIRKRLHDLGYNIKVISLSHPTVFPEINFSMEKFIANKNKKLVNVGSWYRNPITIHRIPEVADFKMCTLKGKKMEANFPTEDVNVSIKDDILQCNTNIWSKCFIKYINEEVDDYSKRLNAKIRDLLKNKDSLDIKPLIQDFINKVEVIDTLSDDDYDKLFTNNIVFLDLVDASVANTIIECIVRDTPVVVNRIPPTVELLGEDYPLFYNKISEIPSLLTIENISEAHRHISDLNHNIYRLDYFVNSLLSSEIYKSL
jgi:hypothetical protein